MIQYHPRNLANHSFIKQKIMGNLIKQIVRSNRTEVNCLMFMRLKTVNEEDISAVVYRYIEKEGVCLYSCDTIKDCMNTM